MSGEGGWGGGLGGGEEQQVEGGRKEEGKGGMGGERDVFKTKCSSSHSSVAIAVSLRTRPAAQHSPDTQVRHKAEDRL